MSAPMKNSRQRNAILECVMSHHDHPTADIIYQELRESLSLIHIQMCIRDRGTPPFKYNDKPVPKKAVITIAM